MGNRRGVPVGESVRGRLLADAPNPSTQQPGIAAQEKRILGLYTGIAPPLNLLAPWGVDISVQSTTLLRPCTGFPNTIQISVGTVETPLALQRVADPVELDADLQRMH